MAFGVVVVAVLTLIAGGVIGLVAFGVSKIIYLILIFPLFMGGIGGVLVEVLIKKFKVHKPVWGITFGILMGISICFAFFTTQYVEFKREITQYFKDELLAQYGLTDPALVAEIYKQAILDETGYPGMIGFISIVIKDGISIGHISGGSSINLGPFLSVVYMLVELIILVGVPIQVGKQAASRPFCETCGEWFGAYESLGAARIDQTPMVVNALRANNYLKAAEILGKSAEIPSVDVYLKSCGTCRTGNSILKVKIATFDAKNKVQVKTVFTAVLTPRQRADLISELNRPV